MGDNPENGVNVEEPEQFRKLFVGGLSPSTTVDSFKEFYSKFGTILNSIVVQDPITGKSRGFGFITYSSKSEVNFSRNIFNYSTFRSTMQ
jgi:RNA recognition motif-containing protein